MRRGMSKAYINRSVVSRARELVLSDVCTSSETEDQALHVAETPVFTFVLPNINIYPDGFKAFLHKELIESSTLVSLEQGGENLSFQVMLTVTSQHIRLYFLVFLFLHFLVVVSVR